MGGGAFGRRLGHEAGALTNGLRVLPQKGKETRALFTTCCSEKSAVCNPEAGPHRNPGQLAPDLRLPASRMVRNICLLSVSHPVPATLLIQPKLRHCLSSPRPGCQFSSSFVRFCTLLSLTGLHALMSRDQRSPFSGAPVKLSTVSGTGWAAGD